MENGERRTSMGEERDDEDGDVYLHGTIGGTREERLRSLN